MYSFLGVHFTIQKCQSWQGWGCIQAGVVLFQNQFLTGVVLHFEWGEVLFKSGIAFARMRQIHTLTRALVSRGPMSSKEPVKFEEGS